MTDRSSAGPASPSRSATGPSGAQADAPWLRGAAKRAWWRLRWQVERLPSRAVARGLSPRLTGWRGLAHVTPAQHLATTPGAGEPTVLHPARRHENPLPGNVRDRDALDPDPGWWGYAMRDVPTRLTAESYLAPLRDMRVLAYRDGPKKVFTPGMIDAANRAVDMPQIVFRPPHAAALRGGLPVQRIESGIWFLERAYDNHSHWLTAHLPKLVLLRSLGRLPEAIMPAERGAAIDASLAMLGIDPAGMTQFDPGRMLCARDLSVLVTDRFDPALLCPLRDALRQPGAGPATRRVYISRARSRGRKLANEDRVWPELRQRGFERVFMEDLDFPAQVRLMNETAVMVAPHGAGITNMIFCPEGADIVEIADPGYPNPNFYALACAMSHRYWLVHATAQGSGHALEKNLTADLAELQSVLRRIDAARTGA